MIRTALVCSMLAIILYAPFWRGGDVLGVERRSTLFTASLPALAQVQLEKILGEQSSQQAVSWAAFALTITYVIWTLALAALLPEGVMGRLAASLTYTAPWKMIAFDFFINAEFLPPRVWRETWLGLSTLGVVWLYVAYAAFRKHFAFR